MMEERYTDEHLQDALNFYKEHLTECIDIAGEHYTKDFYESTGENASIVDFYFLLLEIEVQKKLLYGTLETLTESDYAEVYPRIIAMRDVLQSQITAEIRE